MSFLREKRKKRERERERGRIHLNDSDGSRNKTNLAYNYIVSFDRHRQAEERTNDDLNVNLCKETNTRA